MSASAKHITPRSAPGVKPNPPALDKRTMRAVGLLMPKTRKRALDATFKQLMEEVIEPLLGARTIADADRILVAQEDHASAIVRYIWDALIGYEPVALRQNVNAALVDYERVTRDTRMQTIRSQTRTLHDQAHSLLSAARTRLAVAGTIPPTLAPRALPLLVRVEVLTIALMAVLSGETKVRSKKLLEGLATRFFEVSLRMYAMAEEIVSYVSVPRASVEKCRLTTELVAEGRRFVLHDHLAIELTREEGGFVAYAHAALFCAGGRSADAAFEGIVAGFASSWDALVEADESGLSLDALAHRARLRELVREVAPAS